MRRILILLSSTLLLATIACQRTILGSWHQVNGKDTISFYSDGSYAASMAWGPKGTTEQLSGTYFILGRTVNMQSNLSPSDSMQCAFSFDGSEMTLTYLSGGMVKVDGTSARFKRD